MECLVAGLLVGGASAESNWTLQLAVMGRVRGRFLPNNAFGSLAEPSEVNLTDGRAVFGEDWPVYGGPARIARVVEELREDPSKNVLFVDLGGFFYTNLWYRFDELETAISVYERMGVDVAACDNWDWYSCEQTCAVYGAWIDRLDVPVVAANLDASQNEFLSGRVAPWTVANVDGVEVGVIGLADTDLVQRIGGALPGEVSARSARTWSNSPPFRGDDVATAIAALENEHPGCAIIVLLVGELNINGGTEFYEYMYDAYPSLDVIVSFEPWVGVEEQVLVRRGDAESKAAYVRATLASTVTGSDTSSAMSIATIEFDGEGKVVNATNRALQLGDDTDVKGDVWEVVVASLDDAYGALEEVVGYSGIFLDGERSLDETATGPQALGCYKPDCSLGRVAALADLELCGDCDFALENGGVVRASIDAGNVTALEVRTSFIFDNQIQSIELSGDAVLELLDHAVTQVFDYQQCDQLVPAACGGEGQLECVLGACELHGGIPQFAGLRWAFNAPNDEVLSAEIYSRADDSWYAVDPEATYKVATNSFIMSGGNEYDVFLDRGENLDTLPVGQVQAIIDFITAYSPLYHDQSVDAVKNGQPIFEAGTGSFAKCGAFETDDGYAPVGLPVRASVCTSISSNISKTEYREAPLDVTIVVASDAVPETDDEAVAIDRAIADAGATLFPATELCWMRVTLDAAAAESSSSSSSSASGALVAQLEAAVDGVEATCPSGRIAAAAPLAWVVNLRLRVDDANLELSGVESVEELDADFGLIDIVPQVDTTLNSLQACFLAPDAEDMADAANAIVDHFAWTQVLFLYTRAFEDHVVLFEEKKKAGLFVSSALLGETETSTVADDAVAALEAFSRLRVVVVSAKPAHVAEVLEAARRINATEGYAYIHAIGGDQEDDAGVLDTVGALVIHKAYDDASFVQDATRHAAATVSALVSAYRAFDVAAQDTTIDSFHDLSEKTTLLRQYARQIDFRGESGRVETRASTSDASSCQRVTSLAVSSVASPGTLVKVGEWNLDDLLTIGDVKVWPGNVSETPIGGATECSAGSYYRPEDASCVECDPGQRVNDAKTDCEACPAGRYRNTDGTECRYCAVNEYQDEEGQVECLPCPDNTDRTQAESNFLQDPANEGADVAATAAAIEMCACISGFYSSDSNKTLDAKTETPQYWGIRGKSCKPCF
ncbi:hypothetical protein CTAYLR_003028 [Chrysophaeum taylorii]|uniref:Tyrosine-protein kinase ephrin type A/B receptor-like domain-containing protein n=1 Tax=Chrysophaeum taylorii TaxID=2483200 RepID=A0AAD7U558_9STRA|nr:hypothetical protein CTAYLR_003028 [Chrysophaeum taylorii]